MSNVAQLFDPLDLISPIIIKRKIILQNLWQLKLTWDQSVPLNIFPTWKEFVEQLTYLKGIQVPRYVASVQSVFTELHGFLMPASSLMDVQSIFAFVTFKAIITLNYSVQNHA